MNAVIGWIIGVVVILGGGYLLITLNSSSDTMTTDEVVKQDTSGGNAEASSSDAMTDNKKSGGSTMKDETTQGDTMMKKGIYEAYTASKLAMADSGDVVLFFRASWCPTCKALDADIRAHMSAIPSGLAILDVDYDNSYELKQKYGVTYQHTLVQVDSKGTLIKKWSGSPTLVALVAQVQ